MTPRSAPDPVGEPDDSPPSPAKAVSVHSGSLTLVPVSVLAPQNPESLPNSVIALVSGWCLHIIPS